MSDMMIRSGCEHDPNETSVDFCWRCRIAELEAELMSVSDGAAMTDMHKDKRIEKLEQQLEGMMLAYKICKDPALEKPE